MVISLGIGGLLRVDSHWLLPTLLVVVGAITNGVFNPANSTAMIAMMPKEHRGFASAMNHVTFGFGSVFGVALGGLCMSLAFEHYTGVKSTSLTTENARGVRRRAQSDLRRGDCLDAGGDRDFGHAWL